jgi:hypothetical protein
MCIAALASAFRVETDEAMFEGYWLGLDDLDLSAIKNAARKALRHCKFMPSSVELRELSGQVSGDGRALLAWDAFQRAVVGHGGYRTVQFDDPVINATVRNLGGWQRCCDMAPEEFDKWLRKDFLATYQSLHAAGAGSSEPLLGIFGQQNAATGQHHGPSEQIEFVRTGLPGLPELEAPKERKPAEIAFSGGIGRLPT